MGGAHLQHSRDEWHVDHIEERVVAGNEDEGAIEQLMGCVWREGRGVKISTSRQGVKMRQVRQGAGGLQFPERMQSRGRSDKGTKRGEAISDSTVVRAVGIRGRGRYR